MEKYRLGKIYSEKFTWVVLRLVEISWQFACGRPSIHNPSAVWVTQLASLNRLGNDDEAIVGAVVTAKRPKKEPSHTFFEESIQLFHSSGGAVVNARDQISAVSYL